MSFGEMFVSGLSAVWGGGTMFLMVIVIACISPKFLSVRRLARRVGYYGRGSGPHLYLHHGAGARHRVPDGHLLFVHHRRLHYGHPVQDSRRAFLCPHHL